MPRNIIKEGDGTETEIWGFRSNFWRTAIAWTLYICTAFFLRLVFYWRPQWAAHVCYKQCSFDEAELILAKDHHQQFWINHVILTTETGDSLKNNIRKKCNRVADIEENKQYLRFFVHKKLKYIWSWEKLSFEALRGLEHIPCSEFHNRHPLTEKEIRQYAALYGPNEIRIEITPILVFLLKEGLSPFYVFQIGSCIVWIIDDYYIFATCILIMSAISLIVQLYQTRKNEKSLRDTFESHGKTIVCRDGSKFTALDSNMIVPGDMVSISREGGQMYCDAVLISGTCVVDESMLTGESVPVTKTVLPNTYYPSQSSQKDETNKDTVEYLDLMNHTRHILFCGTKVLQAYNLDEAPVIAIVIRTGFLTSKGEMVRSIIFPKPIDATLNKDSMMFVMVLASFAIIGFIYTNIVMIRHKASIRKMVLLSLELITIIVPPALPMAMTTGIVFAQSRLKGKNIFCISPTTINTCGNISLVCFDKTGTITEDGLNVYAVVANRPNGTFDDPVEQVDELSVSPLVECIATCHSLSIINGQLCGDPLDLKMFESIKWSLRNANSFDEEEFQMSVPFVVFQRNKEDDEMHKIAILRQFTFSSSFQRMAVITKSRNSDNFVIYVKGAPETIQTICRKDSVPSDFMSTLLNFTHHGYRVLALAYRVLKANSLDVAHIPRQEVEKDLNFLGFLVMENRLKSETKAVINDLKMAKIPTVMVTGDNLLTAISVARDCGIIDDDDRVILVNARWSTNVPCSTVVEFHYVDGLQRSDNRQNKVVTYNSNADGSVHTNIPMLDQSNFHFSVNGRSWAIIREYFPELINKIAVKGSVFARFKPEQKAQLIELLQSMEHIVCMCGDGANDCSALKAAHAGISLSEAEASVASAFTSKNQNISCVLDIIKEGRCALTTSLGMFKYMAGYSFTQFISVLILSWFGANLSNFQFLYVDLFIITTLSITYSYTKACNRLSQEKPNIRLLSAPVFMSLVTQWMLNTLFQSMGFVYVSHQTWYNVSTLQDDDMYYIDYVYMEIFCISVFQYIIMAIAFSKGSPFRAPIYTNYIFVTNLAILFALTTYIVFKPFKWLTNVFELVEFPSIAVNGILYAFVFGNFIVSYFVEFIIDKITFSQTILKVKMTLFPRLVKRLKYEKVEEDVDRNLENWPTLIRSLSVQDMRHDIFTDTGDTEFLQPLKNLCRKTDVYEVENCPSCTDKNDT